MVDELHKHEWVPIKEGYQQRICKCGLLRTPGLKVGQNTITINVIPTAQELIRWTSFHSAAQSGDLGMHNLGRPNFFVGGATGGTVTYALGINEVNPNRYAGWQTNPALTTLTNVGTGTVQTVASPGVAAASASLNTYGWGITCTTAAAIGSDAGLLPGAFTDVRGEHAFSASFIFRTGADITNVRYWVGVFGSTPMASSAPGTNHAAFRYDTSVDGTAFWRCLTSAAAAQQSTTTTQSITANTSYAFRVATDGSTYRFSSGLTGVAAHSTTIPGGTSNMGPVLQVRALAAAAKGIIPARITLGQNLVSA